MGSGARPVGNNVQKEERQVRAEGGVRREYGARIARHGM